MRDSHRQESGIRTVGKREYKLLYSDGILIPQEHDKLSHDGEYNVERYRVCHGVG